jgi:hypothetical protein
VKFIVRDELIPYEYKCVPKEHEALYNMRKERLPTPFLKEWYRILDKSFAKDEMGLMDMLAEEQIDGFESSDPVRRLNIVTARPSSTAIDFYIPTLWQSHVGPKAGRKCGCGGRRPKDYPQGLRNHRWLTEKPDIYT